MEKIVLDFTGVKDVFSLYFEMSSKMNWESWYAYNLDALYDILTAEPLKSDKIEIIRKTTYTDVPWNHGDLLTQYINRVCNVFQDAAEDRECLQVAVTMK